jgi:hypothetical protein
MAEEIVTYVWLSGWFFAVAKDSNYYLIEATVEPKKVFNI